MTHCSTDFYEYFVIWKFFQYIKGYTFGFILIHHNRILKLAQENKELEKALKFTCYTWGTVPFCVKLNTFPLQNMKNNLYNNTISFSDMGPT